METKTGVIVNLHRDKGYGFIRPDEQGTANIFFHASGVLSPSFDELVLNERVEFLVKETPKGKQAFDVAVM